MEYEEMTVKNDYTVKMQIGYQLYWSDVTACTSEEAVEKAKEDLKTSIAYGGFNPGDSDGEAVVLSVEMKRSE